MPVALCCRVYDRCLFHVLVQLKGVTTNLEYLRLIAAASALAEGQTTTKFVEGLDYAPPAGQAWCRVGDEMIVGCKS